MPLKFKIKKDDIVFIICGDDKKKKGKVLSVLKKSSSLVVEGINLVKKAQKKAQNGEENFKFIEKPIHISNVKLDSSSNNKKEIKKKKS